MKKKFFVLPVFFLTGTFFLMYTMYKTTDVLDNVVEKTAEVLGVKPAFITEKKARKEREKKEIQKADSLRIAESEKLKIVAVDSSKILAEQKEKRLEELAVKKKEEFNDGLVTSGVKLEKAEKIQADEQKKEEPKEDDDDGLVVAANATTKKKKVVAETNVPKVFTAKVYGNHILKNDATVTFRFNEPVTYKSERFEADHMFFAKVNVFQGDVFFVVDKIDQYSVKMDGYNEDEKRKAFPLKDFYKNPAGDFVLSEGREVAFTYN